MLSIFSHAYCPFVYLLQRNVCSGLWLYHPKRIQSHLKKCLFKPFAHVWIGLFILLLLLNCRNPLYIQDIYASLLSLFPTIAFSDNPWSDYLTGQPPSQHRHSRAHPVHTHTAQPLPCFGSLPSPDHWLIHFMAWRFVRFVWAPTTRA